MNFFLGLRQLPKWPKGRAASVTGLYCCRDGDTIK